MSYTVINHKEVKNDVLQAKEWYKIKQNGLEKRFANAINITLNYVVKNPFLFQVNYKNVRTAYTEIFPYGIHYCINEATDTITVLGIFHTSISPDKWLKRL